MNLVNVEGVHDGNIHMIISAFPILSIGGVSSYLVLKVKLDVVQTLLCFIQHGFHMVHRWLVSFELRLKTWQNFIRMDETSIWSSIVEKIWWPMRGGTMLFISFWQITWRSSMSKIENLRSNEPFKIEKFNNFLKPRWIWTLKGATKL